MIEDKGYTNIDVFRMAMECELSIFNIYETLGLTPDIASQKLLNDLANAKTPEEWQDAMNAKLHYQEEMGDKRHGRFFEVRALTAEDKAELDRRIAEKDYVALFSRIPAVRQSQLRVKTGIPWGTRPQMDKIRKDAELCDQGELLKLYKSIPPDAENERSIVLKRLAGRFFQKPPEV